MTTRWTERGTSVTKPRDALADELARGRPPCTSCGGRRCQAFDQQADLLLAALRAAGWAVVPAQAAEDGLALAAAFADRNLVVQAFGWAMEQAGWPVAWGVDVGEPDWPVLYIATPAGQVSWHIPKAERVYEPPVRPEHGPVAWDGHTTDEKFDRLRALFAAAARKALEERLAIEHAPREPEEPEVGPSSRGAVWRMSR
jgi:hypothetical protein